MTLQQDERPVLGCWFWYNMAKSATANTSTPNTTPTKAPPTGPKSNYCSGVCAAETEVWSGGGGSDTNKEFEASTTQTWAEKREKEESKQGDDKLGQKYQMDQIWQHDIATGVEAQGGDAGTEFKKGLQHKLWELAVKETVGQAKKGQLETRLNELKETLVGWKISSHILYFTLLAHDHS